MAVIGKIREKSTLLVIFVGLGLLLFIIPFDRIANFMYGTGEQPIGSIDDNPMMDSQWHYNYKVDSTIATYRQQAAQRGQVLVLDEQQNEQIKNQVWGQMILDYLYGKELAEVPLKVGKKELNDVLIYGDEPSKIIKDMFTYDGVFRKDSVKPYIDKVLVAGKGAKAWLFMNVEEPIRKERLREKYNKMAKYGIYVTEQDARREYIAKNTKANIYYTFKEFSTIPDTVVTVTDEDLKKYYDEHKNEEKWKQETETRTIDYVTFKIVPSQEDKERAMANMERLKKSFQKATNDSMFVANNAATPIDASKSNNGQFTINSIDVLPKEPYKPGSGSFSVETDELIQNAKKGDVIGPIAEGNKLILVKITDEVTKNEATVRHILIKADKADEAGYKKKKAFADSLLRVLKADRSKFNDFVYKYSEDPGSNQPGKDGKYTFDKDINFVQEFKDFGFDKPVGALDIVETSFGFHIMENMERGDNNYKMIAVVDADVKPSKATQEIAYADVVDSFHSKAKKDFDKATEEAGKEIKTAENVRVDNPYIGEIGKNMALAKWNFNHEPGSVSDPEFVSHEIIAVTRLKSATHEGVPDFEGVKDLMRPYVVKEKKAEYLLTKIGSATDVDEISTLVGSSAQPADITLAMDNLPGLAGAIEPKLIGTIFATESGTTTKPFKGNNGVYAVKINSKTPAPETQDYSTEKASLLAEWRTDVESKIIEALAKSADFKDWRMKRQIMNR